MLYYPNDNEENVKKYLQKDNDDDRRCGRKVFCFICVYSALFYGVTETILLL